MFRILRILVHVLRLRLQVLCFFGTSLQISKYFLLYAVNSLQVSVADLNRALGLRAPLSPIFLFNFIPFLGKNGQNNRFALPPSGLVPPPPGNHGSATVCS